MATNTYVALKTTTVGTAVPSVTLDLTGISGYTDLVLVAKPLKTTTGGGTIRYQVNSDTATNYSNTTLYGDGSSPGSDRASNASYGRIGFWTGDNQGNTLIAHFQNYSNTTTYKTVLSRTGNLGSLLGAVVNLWRSTSTITSIYIYNDGGNFDVGSTFTVYGIANADNFTKATGGIISEDSTYTYHVFGASGTFTPKQSLTADVLIIAGGGGGGWDGGAGGGAGGLVYSTSQSLTATGYTVSVGAGGAGGISSTAQGKDGTSSSFNSVSATGGGGGGRWSAIAGNTGGSGGGGGAGFSSGGTGGAGTSGQGYAGGNGVNDGSARYGGGGGGGAGAAGSNAVAGTGGGNGGAGSSSYSSWGAITGTGQNVSGTYYYAAGGGGSGGNTSGTTIGYGGYGGGGNGGRYESKPGVAALINTGSGGGGAGDAAAGGSGGAGGSGIVIIRYPK